MSLDSTQIWLRAPSYPEETPFWPCALFIYGDEIVAALYFDDADDGGGFGVDAEGVVDDSPVEGTGHRDGWTMHVLAEPSPSATDPRASAPDVEVWGDELTMPEVMESAYTAVAARARPRGLTYEASREHLVWKPVDGWPRA